MMYNNIYIVGNEKCIREGQTKGHKKKPKGQIERTPRLKTNEWAPSNLQQYFMLCYKPYNIRAAEVIENY